ncbi:MAG: hypothetical protein IKW59_09155 [Clostridia bacterium]|nr:hypothetical protein [Clostridia bacterium]
MEDIKFYDFEFNLLAIQNDFISVNWQIYFNDIGQFEAHFSNDSEIVKIITGKQYIVAVQGEKAAVIVGWQSSEDFAVFGRTCNWILSKRVVPAFEIKTGGCGELANQMVMEIFSDALTVETTDENISQKTVEIIQEDYRLLSDAVIDCLELGNLGHRVIFDTKQKKWLFKIIYPKEILTVISEGNRNGAELEFLSDCIDLCSGGWYLKEQEKADDGTVLEPIWSLKEIKALNGIYRWESILSARSETEAVKELEKKKIKNSAKALAVDFAWHTDYELGDTVKMKIEKAGFEKTALMRIVGVHLWYEENDVGEQPIMEE